MGGRRGCGWVVGLGVVVVAGAVGVTLLAEEGDDGVGEGGGPGGAEPCPGRAPLLGEPGDVVDQAALAVKIENTAGGRPPVGLNEADVVFEEQVEGRLTRLLAVYQSQDPEVVGPVRSARTTDLSVLAELDRPLFAWSGANEAVREVVVAADIVDVGAAAAPDAYHRAPDRSAPYNLFAGPADLRTAGTEAAGTDTAGPAGGGCDRLPPALFEYRAAADPLAGPGVEEARAYEVTGLATAIRWDWDPARGWLRTQDGTPHVDAEGRQVAVPNVVVRTTPYRDSGQRDVRGAVVPEAETVGEGDALLLSGGRAQPGRWRKASVDAPTTYTALDGTPLRLAPGRTWVEVLPPGTGAATATGP